MLGIETPEFVPLIIAGIASATAAMAVGIGGGILWTPLLIIGYGLSPLEAVTSSLIIQLSGLGSGAIAYFSQRNVKFKLSFIFFLVALPGVIAGSFAAVRLPENQVQLALGIMAMLLAIFFVATQESTDPPITSSRGNYDAGKVRSLLPIPGFFGLLMGFLSVGISEWMIPALQQRLRLGMCLAIGTVIPMMFMLAAVAAGIHFYQAESINWDIIIWGSVGTLIGGQIGPRINQLIPERVLKETFIYLMTLIGIHLIFQAV